MGSLGYFFQRAQLLPLPCCFASKAVLLGEVPGLQGGGRDPDDLRTLGNRSLVIVHEVDDLSMLTRQMDQRLPQQFAAVLLFQGSFGITGR